MQSMSKKPTKTIVATIIFTLIEAAPIKGLIVALLAINKALSGLAFNVLAWIPALALTYFIGWLIFSKWTAKFWIKSIVAAVVVLVSIIVMGMVAVSLLQQFYSNNPPY